ncbi:MAG: ligase-associated DNA damage response exonuclease [Cryomorphaceae bacterium]
MALISFTDKGLYCEKADVYIDPWKPVDKALITHAHADHSRWGMGTYAAHKHSLPVMRWRLGDIEAIGVEYGEQLRVNGVDISFHPAGHIPGSAQIRLAHKGEVWVVSGDYKAGADGLSTPFEPVKCTHFITESTFGLPAFRWQPQEAVMSEINAWWAENRKNGQCSLLLCYALGKAQRILNNLDPTIGEIFLHGAIVNTNTALESVGYEFTDATYLSAEIDKARLKGAMVLAPPSALGSSWTKKLKPFKTATASGWMSLRGARRRRHTDRGFIFSDHVDWDELNAAVDATRAQNIFVTHGYSDVYSKWLRSKGLNAVPVKTEYEGELSDIGESRSEEKDTE